MGETLVGADPRDPLGLQQDYRRLLAARTKDELHDLAHVKRFIECVNGDADFRARLSDNEEELIALARERGCEINPMGLLPLFHPGYRHEVNGADPRFGLTRLWNDYITDMVAFRNRMVRLGETHGCNPRFDAWRHRQIQRANSQLGPAGEGIIHPVVAFELSRGCSVGCWFCGISAKEYGGSLAYDAATEAEWRGVLARLTDVLGPALQSGFCYWGTDPMDNPDYPKFIEAFQEVTGWLPQTTTAIPLRNVELTRSVMQQWAKAPTVTNRFSVLSVNVMRRIHKTFTPEELMGVEMVMQQKGSTGRKAVAGRAADPASKRPSDDPALLAAAEDHKAYSGTIACVTGFLVNMMDRRIQLVSPTPASEAWPNGYIIFDERTFDGPAGFEQAVRELIDANMPVALKGGDTVAFRPDLKLSLIEGGFELSNDMCRFASDGFTEIATFLDQGPRSLREVIAHAAQAGENPIQAIAFIEDSFRAGLLVEPRAVA